MADEQDYRDAAEKTVVVGREFSIPQSGIQLPDPGGKWVPAWIYVSDYDAENHGLSSRAAQAKNYAAQTVLPSGRVVTNVVSNVGVDGFLKPDDVAYFDKEMFNICDDGEPHEWFIRRKIGGGLESWCKHCKRTK